MQAVPAFSHMWHEFCMELRYRWESATPAPFLDEGSPDLGSCLLLQKLQVHKWNAVVDALVIISNVELFYTKRNIIEMLYYIQKEYLDAELLYCAQKESNAIAIGR